MEDVELRALVPAQLEHERQVGVVLGDLDVRRRADVVAAGTLRHHVDRQLDRAETGVGPGGGEDGDLVATPDELARQVPRHRLQAAGEGLGDGEAAVGDQADPQSLAGESSRHPLTSR